MSLYLGENLISGQATLVGESRNIGQIIPSAIPLTDAGLHLLDGSLIQGGGIYSTFVTYIAGLVSTYPNLFVTEAQWQQSVTDYGVCGKFVYDSTNNTVRLPKVTGILEGTTDVTALGDLVEAGLPSIPQHTHSPLYVGGSNEDLGDPGAYCVTANTQYNGIQTNTNGYTGNASTVTGGVYGNSSTVQPQTIKAFYYIVIATATKTDIQVDIDEIATDLNGKAGVDLTNVNNAGTSRGASWAMPSGTSVYLTLGASGSTYVAPADGWVYFETSKVTQAGYQSMFAGDIGIESRTTLVGSSCTIFLPVHKGAIFYVFYDTQGTRTFRFVYAIGSESEAS